MSAVAARFLDHDARKEFKRAIETIENVSAVEVVVAIRRRSGDYHHANAIVGALLAVTGLAAMLYSEHTFALRSILVDPFVVGLIGAALVEFTPHIKRWLTPGERRRREVMRAARATFVERGIHNTTGRSGLLVYISWLEREVALVADSGLAATISADALARTEAELTLAVPRGGAEVAGRLAALADAAARAMPRSTTDINELSDELDSDLGEK